MGKTAWDGALNVTPPSVELTTRYWFLKPVEEPWNSWFSNATKTVPSGPTTGEENWSSLQMFVLKDLKALAHSVELVPLISCPAEKVCPPSSEKERKMGDEM